MLEPFFRGIGFSDVFSVVEEGFGKHNVEVNPVTLVAIRAKALR
jgi:hypothetical protein